MVELAVILVFAFMFLGPCALATGMAHLEDEEADDFLAADFLADDYQDVC